MTRKESRIKAHFRGGWYIAQSLDRRTKVLFACYASKHKKVGTKKLRLMEPSAMDCLSPKPREGEASFGTFLSTGMLLIAQGYMDGEEWKESWGRSGWSLTWKLVAALRIPEEGRGANSMECRSMEEHSQAKGSYVQIHPHCSFFSLEIAIHNNGSLYQVGGTPKVKQMASHLLFFSYQLHVLWFFSPTSVLKMNCTSPKVEKLMQLSHLLYELNLESA